MNGTNGKKPGIGKKILFVTIFLTVSASVMTFAWLSFRGAIGSVGKLAKLEFEISNPAGQDKECRLIVNDSQFVMPAGFKNNDPFLGDETETYWIYLDDPSDPIDFKIINRSDREAYMRVNIVPEWQTVRLTSAGAVLTPLLAPEVNLPLLFNQGFSVLLYPPPQRVRRSITRISR